MDEKSGQINFGTGHTVTETGQRFDRSIVTEEKNAHKSYSEVAATNIPQQPHITPVSEMKYYTKRNKIC